MLSHYEGLQVESSKSSLDLYPQVLENKQIQPRVMSVIDNKEKTVNITLLEARKGAQKVHNNIKLAKLKSN